MILQKPLTIKSNKDDQLTRVKTFDQGRKKYNFHFVYTPEANAFYAFIYA